MAPTLLRLALSLALVSGCQCNPARTAPVRPQIDATPASLDFGTTRPGATVERTLTLRNPGAGALTITSLTVTGDAQPHFALAEPALSALAAGSSAELTVRYSPREVGVHAARLEVLSDAANTSEFVITLGGAAVGADACATVTCDRPPGPCFAPLGTCAAGACRYAPRPGVSCDDADACTSADVCDAAGACRGTATRCATPPAASCVDAQTQRTFEVTGTCQASGACAYPQHDTACPLGCDAASGACRSSCGAGQHECNGGCVSNLDVATCGASCTACPAPAQGTATCDGTACGFTCGAGFHACGAGCAENAATASCGTSCTPCLAPANATATCDGARCGFACDAGYVACGGGCCPGASALSVGARSCAVTTAGGVKCWGNGTLTPMDEPGLTSGVGQVAVNSFGVVPFTCVLTAQGAVRCWGRNNQGQLGDGSFTDRATPAEVSGLGAGVVALSTGLAHACAVTSGGAAKCWGMNIFGQLGNGGTAASNVPVSVTGLSSGVVAIGAGEGFSCAVLSAGGARCWGSGTAGQLGNGNSADQLTPVAVSGISSGATRVALGSSHACAIVSGAVKCWGSGSFGELGNGSGFGSATPVDVPGLSSVTALALGGQVSCAVAAGALRCWGRNQAGQVGDGTTSSRSSPVPVLTFSSDVATVATSGGSTCAATTAGRLKCWGSNAQGNLGDGSTADTSTPVSVVGF